MEVTKEETMGMFSLLVYEDNSMFYDGNVQEFIGAGWMVMYKDADVAVYVNNSRRWAVRSWRGTDFTLWRDWVNNMDGLFHQGDGRIMRNIHQTHGIIKSLEGSGYTIMETGHSAGGDYASGAGALEQHQVYVFNAPQYGHQHDKFSYMRAQLAWEGKLHSYVHQGDLVYKIDTDRSATWLHQREHNLILNSDLPPRWSSTDTLSVLKSPLPSLELARKLFQNVVDEMKYRIHAHSMDNTLRDLSGGKWKGFSSRDPAATSNNDIVNLLLSAHDAHRATPCAAPPHHQQPKVTLIKSTNDHLFFGNDKVFARFQLADGQTRDVLIDDHPRLSKHTTRAMSIWKKTLFGNTARKMTEAGHIDLKSLLRDSTRPAIVGFVDSVAADKLNKVFGANICVGSIGTNVGYAVLSGDSRAAIEIATNGALSQVASSVAGLPISAGVRHTSASGQLFGSGICQESLTRAHVSFGNNNCVAFGLHFDNILTKRALRNGQTVTTFAHETGAHVEVAGALDAAIGLRSGYDISSKIVRTDDHGITTEKWFDRQFSGEFDLSLQFGSRKASFRLLPAFSSHTRHIRREFRKDGGDLATRRGLQCKHQDLPSYVLIPLARSSCADAIAKDSTGALARCKAVDGRTEHDKVRKTIRHKKTRFFCFHERWTEIKVYGIAEENKSSPVKNTISCSGWSLNRCRAWTTDTTFAKFLRVTKDGVASKYQETVTCTVHTKSQLISPLVFNLASRQFQLNGESVTEVDQHRLLRDATWKDTMGKCTGKSKTESVLGESTALKESLNYVRRYDGTTSSEQVTDIWKETFEDKRREIQMDAQGKITSDRTFKPGERRAASGLHLHIVDKKNVTGGFFKLTVTDDIDTTSQKYTTHTGVSGGERIPFGTKTQEHVHRVTETGFIFNKTTDLKRTTKGTTTTTTTNLSPGSQMVVSNLCMELLETFAIVYDRYCRQREAEKKGEKLPEGENPLSWSDVARAAQRIFIDSSELLLLGRIADVAYLTKTLLKGCSYAVLAIAFFAFIRYGRGRLSDQKWLSADTKLHLQKLLESLSKYGVMSSTTTCPITWTVITKILVDLALSYAFDVQKCSGNVFSIEFLTHHLRNLGSCIEQGTKPLIAFVVAQKISVAITTATISGKVAITTATISGNIATICLACVFAKAGGMAYEKLKRPIGDGVVWTGKKFLGAARALWPRAASAVKPKAD